MSDGPRYRVFVIDDDPLVIELISRYLETAGHEFETATDSAQALKRIGETKPDVIISDLMMPGIDGYELCKRVKSDPEMANIRFIVLSAKAYQFDENRVYEFGADGFIRKPVELEPFVEYIKRIMEDRIDMVFWGVRGTLPVSGGKSLRYGGNTSCMTLEFPRGQYLIFDGGSGIKALADHLMRNHKKRMKAKILISHPHWDHINAIPFFTPLYVQGNDFEILGANQGDTSMRQLISAQMDGVYFPITLSEFAARVYFRDLEEGQTELDGLVVKTKLLSHPGKCLGYRVEYGGRSICYVTDNEMYLEDSEYHDRFYEDQLADFVRGSDALITDTTYMDDEYETKVGWGHSCVSKVVELAHRGEIKTLYLFHHDPDQSDADIDKKLEVAEELLHDKRSDTKVLAPSEGQLFRI